MHAVDPDALAEISTRLAVRMIEVFDLDTSSVALEDLSDGLCKGCGI